MDILYLVDRLDNLIASSRRMPFTNQLLVKEDDILNILEQMRNSIPDEVKQARRILQERDRILSQAQTEAADILAKTHEESEHVLSREGLLRSAEERSKDLLRQANEKAQGIVQKAEEHTEQMKAEADSYARETLNNIKEHLISIETEIGRNILSIEKGLETLEEQKYEEIYADDIEKENELAELEEIRTPIYPTPRRASLANDTMGGPNIQP